MSITKAQASSPTDSLGCTSSQLYKDQEVSGAGIQFYRKLSRSAINQVETPATDRGFLVGVSLLGGHRRTVMQGTQRSVQHFDRHDIYIRDFADRYRADLEGPFDFLLMELSHAAIEAVAHDGGRRHATGVSSATGLQDTVLSHLACALAPALDRPAETSRLFIDQISLAMATHLVQRYGHEKPGEKPRRGVLSRLQEARAKEMLSERIDGNVSLEEIADACGLSRSHFFRAFRDTTGRTPHQWLLEQKIERAQHLLRDSTVTLVEVAARCGFADQSHFTRVFTRAMSTPPGLWRHAHSPAQPRTKASRSGLITSACVVSMPCG